jgi:hypothetical protein
MKQAGEKSCRKQRNESEVSEFIWETFDGLFKTVYAQGRRVEELEARIADLEQRLNERVVAQKPQAQQPIGALNEMPAERAA